MMMMMMIAINLDKDSKSMLHSPDGDTLAPDLFVICLDYALRISADKHSELGLTLEERRNSRHPARYMTDATYRTSCKRSRAPH